MLNLEKKCVSGNLRKFLQDFLDNQKQIVILNEEVYSWVNVMAGVLQSLVVSPLLFLAYNDLLKGHSSDVKLLANSFFLCNS